MSARGAAASSGRALRRQTRASRCRLALAATGLALLGGTALAQSPTPGGMPPPRGMSLAQSAAMRFPQPVRVGDLLGRDVLRPTESQAFVGTLRQVVRLPDGTLSAVIDLGGFLGLGTRPVAVPSDAMVLVGRILEVVAYTPSQLRHFPRYSVGGRCPWLRTR